MTCVNTEWALNELNEFLGLLQYKTKPGLYTATYVGSDDEINAKAVVAERIWAKVLGPKPVVPINGSDPRRHDREWTVRCVESINREAEITANLGDDAPELNANQMHSWIWEGARSLWQSGHFAEAVGAAARKVNAETQNKVGRRDVSESTLFQQAFSDDAPQVGKARLRLTDDDNGRTAQSVRRGIRSFAEGCFAAIRNPVAHDHGELSLDPPRSDLLIL